jgi:LacI family transcriptional regulator
MPNTPKVLLLIASSREFGRALLTGIVDYARFHGPWSIYTYPPFFRGTQDTRLLLNRMRKSGINGIVAREMGEIPDIIKMGVPAIFASTIEPEKGIPKHSFPIITTDNCHISQLGADHLLDRGFTHFAYCGYDDISWSQLRGRAFQETISQAGHETHFYHQPRSKIQKRWENELPLLGKWLLGLPKPIGLMTCSDDRSRNVVEAANIAGIHIPEEIAVIGVDNDELMCHLATPSLSSIALSTEKAGTEAAQLLGRLMAGQDTMTNQKIIIKPTHVETRHSTNVLAVDDPEVATALRFIREHVKELIQVDDVANATCLSRRTLERRFLKIMGRSVQEEINRFCIEEISKMLIQTRMSQVQISQAMGYHSVDNMRRFFHRHLEMTPLHYRRKLGLQP